MLLAHLETAWGLSLAPFELGGSLGVDLNGRRSSVSRWLLHHPGLFGLCVSTLSVHGQRESLSYKGRWVFFAG